MQKPLKLVLKYRWYDLIEDGTKLEEYREIKESIVSLLFDWRKSGMSRGAFTRSIKLDENSSTLWKYWKPCKKVIFYRGYSCDRKVMQLKITNCTIGFSQPKWSDGPRKQVFVIDIEK